MATSIQTLCVTCVRGTRAFAGRYRAFLLDPGTLFTLGSLLLLVAAIIQRSSGLTSGKPGEADTPLYLAAALVGSVYIWWSALQGIRERDFTADIPVSLATAAALLIHQDSAAAVVAVLLLIGGMLEEFVSARAGKALDALALVFDGDTGHLLTAVLRPGTAHASHGALAVLRRLVRHLRARWPGVQIELRADCGFAVPALYDYCEAQGIPYTIGLSRNARLEALAAALAQEAPRQRAQSGEKVRLLAEGTYQADSWSRARRVVYKAEALDKGLNLRFVVTTRADAPEALYAWYTQRGDRPELCIKDLKEGCFADRLSCRRFWANQFRLLLHGAAYWLLDTLRRWLARRQVPYLQLSTLRLLKIGGWVRQQLSAVSLHLASSHPGEPLWHLLATRPQRL